MAKRKPEKRPGVLVENGGKPIRLANVNIHGVAAEHVRANEQAAIWTRLSMTSDEPMFHRIVQNLGSVIDHCAQAQSQPVALDRANIVFLVLNKQNAGELWIDAAAVSLSIVAKRDIKAGTPVFEHDIGDVTGMDFPLVEIGPEDRVLCLFRHRWRFALFFDFNPDGAFDREAMRRDLGTLYRVLRYRPLYEALAHQETSLRLLAAGWFPFVEVISEMTGLLNACEAGFDLDDEEQSLLARFDRERLAKILSRWLSKPHFSDRETVLRSAIDCFLAGQPVATIKIILTEIEGVLADAYRAVNGKGARLKKLLEFAKQSAEKKAGGSNTLLFPRAFAKYLEDCTFTNFDPKEGKRGHAGSRPAVGHGAADPNSYTKIRALQAILTLDQLSFYT